MTPGSGRADGLGRVPFRQFTHGFLLVQTKKVREEKYEDIQVKADLSKPNQPDSWPWSKVWSMQSKGADRSNKQSLVICWWDLCGMLPADVNLATIG